MIAFLNRYFDGLSERYPDPLDFHRARAMVVISAGTVVIALILLIAVLASAVLGLESIAVDFILLLAVSVVVFGLPLWLIQSGNLFWARLIFISALFLLGIQSLLSTGTFTYSASVMLMVVIAASVFFGNRGMLLSVLVTSLVLVGMGLAESTGLIITGFMTDPMLLVSPISIATMVALILIGGLMLWLVTGAFQRTLTEAQRTAEQLRAIAQIGEAANAMLGAEDLLARLVEMVRDRLAFYHVQIFRIDENGQDAVLVASTGEAGQQLLARGHRLPVGSRSVIGQVTQRGEVVYALDTSNNPVHRANEFLPASRSELALPLFDGEQLIGALDIQSTRPNAFTQSDIETLQVVASLVSSAVRNQQAVAELRSSLAENETLYQQAQTNLQEVERLNRQLTGTAWETYLATGGQLAGLQLEGSRLHAAAAWTPAQRRAVSEGAPVRLTEQGQVLAVPLEVRGNVLGAIEVELPQETSAEDALEIVQAVSDRLALTLDNARLFEETQALAQQEQLVNRIGGRLQSVTQVDEILRVALGELSMALGAEQAAVRLRALDDTAAPATGNGQEG